MAQEETDRSQGEGLALPSRSDRIRFGLPLLVLLVGLVTTGLVALQFSRVGGMRDQERLTRLVDLRTEAIADRLESQLTILRGLAGHFAVTEEGVSAQDFRTYVSRLDLERAYPGTQGVGFAEVTSFENAETLTTRILLLEPPDFRNEAALGYDMFSEEVRRAAMIAARDTGGARMSGMVQLVQEVTRDKSPGFLIFQPVYRGGGIPASVAERRAQFQGWVYSPFRAEDFFEQGILRGRPSSQLAFSVYVDGNEGDRLFETGVPRSGSEDVTRIIRAAGRDWLLVFRPTERFRRASSPFAIGAIGLVGIALTALLARLTHLQAEARAEAEENRDQLAWERTRLDALQSASRALSAELDLRRLVDLVCEKASALCGASYGAFFERRVDDAGEAEWHPFSLSGAKHDDFMRLGTPRTTDLLKPSFEEREIVLVDDVLTDPRYGSMGGMPKGHLPVRSYLSLPVVSRGGEVLGALLFGHPEPGRFSSKDAQLILAFAAQAAIALDNANLFRSAKREIELRKKTELDLIAARERAELESSQNSAILRQLAEGVIVANSEGKIIFVNDAAAEIHGQARLDIPPDDYAAEYRLKTEEGEPYPPRELPLARAVLRQETVESARWRIERPDGTEVIAVGSASPVRLGDGRFVGAVLTLRDDTDRSRYEKALEGLNEVLEEKVIERTRELEEAQARLQLINRNLENLVERRVSDVKAANAEIQRFAYIVSHDLRSPLVNIMGFTGEIEETLREMSELLSSEDDAGRLREDAEESIGFIKAGISKMDSLIGAILKLSRTGQRTFQFRPVDMNDLVGNAVDALQHQADESGATVTVEPLPEIVSDHLALEQIFGNLIDNALKYLDDERPGRITVKATELATDIRFDIEDNGRGIGEADLNRIFDLFRRAGRQDRDGEGIGLAYVRMLVRALGGTIGVRSTLGEGTVFSVTLPIEPPSAEERKDAS